MAKGGEVWGCGGRGVAKSDEWAAKKCVCGSESGCWGFDGVEYKCVG